MSLAPGQLVDLSNYSGEKISVSVSGTELPLKIGDKILLPGNSQVPKTVTSISIFDDMRVVYQLEWFSVDEGQFQTQAVTFNELMLLQASGKKDDEIIGFGLQLEEKKPKRKSKRKEEKEDE